MVFCVCLAVPYGEVVLSIGYKKNSILHSLYNYFLAFLSVQALTENLCQVKGGTKRRPRKEEKLYKIPPLFSLFVSKNAKIANSK